MTLLEVVIAMVTSAVMLAISVPRFQALRAPYTARAAAHQIAAGLERARLRAITRNARHRVTFTVPGATYVIEREVTANNFVAEGGTQALPAGVTVSAVSPSGPVFDTRGMLAAPVTIQFAASAAPTKTVTVNALGQAAIQ